MSEQKEQNETKAAPKDPRESLFRNKSLEQFTAPEQLNDYIRVSRPSVFLIMLAIISFLVGLIIWGYYGTIESHIDMQAYCDAEIVTGYVDVTNGTDQITSKSQLLIGETRYKIRTVSNTNAAREILSPEQLARYGISENALVIGIVADGEGLPDGMYDARIIVAEIRPIDLIFG
jgi:hypothetical protein